jgi:hypothetical protein
MRTQSKRLSILLFMLMILAAGCNLPLLPGGLSPNDQAATAVALTLQANAASIPSPVGSGPILTVDGNTNCRSGPGTNYKIVTTIPAGASVQIIGQYSGGTYWIVTAPDGKGSCWILSELGKVAGDTSKLPVTTLEGNQAGGVPARPVYFFYHYDCTSPGSLTTTLTWSDSSNNETGFRIYRYGVLIAELPANSTTYTDNLPYAPGTNITYDVTAFNSAGESPLRTESFVCQ